MGEQRREQECDAVVFNTETRPRRRGRLDQGRRCSRRATIGQRFTKGTLDGGEPSGLVPHSTRELTGLKAIYTYSEDHDYEHYYITSKYFCWKGLSGVQKGDAAIEPAEYWKFADGQYIFGWTEMIIPCSPIWLICFDGSFGHDRETGIFATTTGWHDAGRAGRSDDPSSTRPSTRTSSKSCRSGRRRGRSPSVRSRYG